MDKEKKKKIIMIILGVVIAVAITIGVIIVVFSFMLSSFLRDLIKQKEDNKYVNVDAVIESVDDGLSAGVRTCTNGDEYLYINGASIFLVDKNGDEEIYTAEHVREENNIDFISFNDKYIFYYVKSSHLCMIDRESGSESTFEEGIYPDGMSADGDKVYVCETFSEGNRIVEIGNGEAVDILGYEDSDEEKDKYVYNHKGLEFYVTLGEESYSIRSGYSNPTFLTNNKWLDGGRALVIPARTAVKNEDVYFVIQTTKSNRTFEHMSMTGIGSFDKEALVRYNPSKSETEILYLIEDNSEQIVNFSVANNKLYTYSGTEIFISDLNGENKTKLCDAPEVEKMYFEYVNDQLLIYDENNNLLGMY